MPTDTAFNWIYLTILIGFIALLFALIKSIWVSSQDSGNKIMQTIAKHIRDGAMAFLYREYKVLIIFLAAVSILLFMGNTGWNRLVAVSFVIGALCSALTGYIGMRIATLANVRTTQAARTSLSNALKVAFSSGSVMGLSVVGLGLIGLASSFTVLGKIFGTSDASLTDLVLPVLSGFSFGASSIALFARVGGGIYTKAADVGADLVGKVEAGIPEDDPRNPATIADNVGDNVGDVAGMGADLFESYVGSIIGAMILGAVYSLNLVVLPLALAGLGIICSLIGTLLVKTHQNIPTGKHIGRRCVYHCIWSFSGNPVRTRCRFCNRYHHRILYLRIQKTDPMDCQTISHRTGNKYYRRSQPWNVINHAANPFHCRRYYDCI
jgi:K(+)-stimulated pyrophosphate-energized sodium pump